MQVHQIIQGFAAGDATSNMARKMRQILVSLGHRDSKIFCPRAHTAPELAGQCLPVEDHRAFSASGNVILYHFGNASPATDYFLSCPDRKIIVYHNVTPPSYYAAVSAAVSQRLADSHRQLEALAPRTDLALCVSDFNRRGLEEAGFTKTLLFPAWIDAEALGLKPDAALLSRLGTERTNVLFVGRLVPNKRIEDLLKIFYYLRAMLPKDVPAPRLIVAGSHSGMELYRSFLLAFCDRLGLKNDVFFTGHIPQEQLNACYHASSAFLCASEHEGFCIPLLEAAFFGIAVTAFDIPAVRETLGGSGVLVGGRDIALAAEAVCRLLTDRALRSAVVTRQKTRLADFSEDRVRANLQNALARATA